MNQTDKRWGGKRRPRITMPTPIKERKWVKLFRVIYTDPAGKRWRSEVACNTAGDAERIALPRHTSNKLVSIELIEPSVIVEFETYDIRYRGEHQDLLRSK